VSIDRTMTREGRELAPTGVNVVAEGGKAVHMTYDARFAVNVNRRADVASAEALR
jgi:adenosylcobinamide-phosphate guanylyltransferase